MLRMTEIAVNFNFYCQQPLVAAAAQYKIYSTALYVFPCTQVEACKYTVLLNTMLWAN